jgi:hypothetical protein
MKRDSLECLAKVLETIWGEIQRLITLQENLLEEISPRFKESVIRKENQIRVSLEVVSV